MKSKPEIRILLLFNLDQESMSDKSKALESYFPKTSCDLTVKALYTRNVEKVVAYLEVLDEDKKPHMIMHYGWGNGCFWTGDDFGGIPSITDDHSSNELFYTDKYLYTHLFDEAIKPVVIAFDKKLSMPVGIHIAKTRADLEYIKKRCMEEPFGFDTETNFLNPFLRTPEPKLLCYSVAWLSDEDEGWCVPTNQKHIDEIGAEYSLQESLSVAEDIFFESTQSMYIHNAIYDLLVLWELFGGRQPKNFAADTMLMLNLYHMASKSASLENNVALVGLPEYKNVAKDYLLAKRGKKTLRGFAGFDSVPLEIIGPYAAMDAIAVVRLVNFLLPELGKDVLTFYYKVPHAVLLTSLELCINGYQLSRDRFNFTKLSVEDLIVETYTLAKSLVANHIGPEFNIASGDQVADLLFKKLKLPSTTKTEGGKDATGSKVLDDLILFHPFIFYLSKVKKLQKVYSSYVKGYFNVLGSGSRVLKKTNSWTFNAQYRQTNRTARLSSSNLFGYDGTSKKGGNILTLPAAGSMVKHFFIPEPVVDLENKLYDALLKELEKTDPVKYAEVVHALTRDISTITKPVVVKPPKIPKVPKVPKAKKVK
jgi:hypothetical protein